MRKKAFENNLKIIGQHNKEYKEGIHSYYMGVNFFSDLTQKEFLRIYLGIRDDDEGFFTRNIAIEVFDIWVEFWTVTKKYFADLINMLTHQDDLFSLHMSIDWRQKV